MKGAILDPKKELFETFAVSLFTLMYLVLFSGINSYQFISIPVDAILDVPCCVLCSFCVTSVLLLFSGIIFFVQEEPRAATVKVTSDTAKAPNVATDETVPLRDLNIYFLNLLRKPA